MRIIVDLQCCQNGSRHRGIGRYAMAITKGLIAQRGDHEILVFLTDRYPEAVHAVRRELGGLLPASSIFVCNMFANTEANQPDNAWRTRAAEIVRTEFLAALVPDIVFVPSLFEGFCDDVVTSIDPAPFRTAVTLHDFIPLEEPERHLSGQHDWDAYARKARDVRRADLSIAISSFTAESAIRFLKVDPARMIVIHNGVEERFGPPELGGAGQALDRLGIRQPFVFNTSPLEHRKNLEGLIAGFARMSRAVIDDHQLVIAGKLSDSARAYLCDLADVAGLSDDKLILPGHVSDEDLIELYGRCELFVFPSFSEGFGLPPLEAMACGAPVIASTTTSLPEVIGRTDMLFDPNDIDALGIAVERVLTDPALRGELRDFGLKRASLFSWNDAATRLLDAFKVMLAGSAVAHKPPLSSLHRPRLAVVLPAVGEASAMAGKCACLAPTLEHVGEITFVREAGAGAEPWLDATFEHHDLDWLDRNAAHFDAIVYVTGAFIGEAVAERMEVYPGIVLHLHELAGASSAVVPDSGMPHIPVLEGDTTRLPGALSCTHHARSVRDYAKALLPNPHCSILDPDDLPPLPVAHSQRAAMEIRRRFDVPPDTPLIVAFAATRKGEQELRACLRDAVAGGATVLVHRTPEEREAEDLPSEQRHDATAKWITEDLSSCYRALISAADVVVSADMSTSFMTQIELDARTLGIPLITDLDAAGSEGRLRAAPITFDRRQPIVGPVSDPALSRCTEVLDEAVTDWRARPPSMLHRVANRLTATVRDVPPAAADIVHLATSVAHNAAVEREPLIWLDLSGYAEHDARPGGHLLALGWLTPLLDRGDVAVRPVTANGGKFVRCDRAFLTRLGFQCPYYSDSSVAIRPADRIVGLEALNSFEAETFSALAHAYAHGASLRYVPIGSGKANAAPDRTLVDLILSDINPEGDGASTGWSDEQIDPAPAAFKSWASSARLPVRIFQPLAV